MFIKYLFPEKGRTNTAADHERGASESSSSGNESIDTSTGGSAVRPRGARQTQKSSIAETSSFGTSLLSGSLRSQKVAENVKQLDKALKAKLSNDFNSVRKAFLAIDDNHRGYITAETLAKYLGATQ